MPDTLLHIPTFPGFGSLNLSHAVAIVCYELSAVGGQAAARGCAPAAADQADVRMGPGNRRPGDGVKTDVHVDRAPRKAVLYLVDRVRRELRERGYRDEVVAAQREHVQEVIALLNSQPSTPTLSP